MSTSKKAVSKVKPLTHEQRTIKDLKEKVAALEDVNEKGSKAYAELHEAHEDVMRYIRTVFKFVQRLKDGGNKATDTTVFTMHNGTMYRGGVDMATEKKELTRIEMLEQVLFYISELHAEFSREDEGTAIMSEHRDDMMILLRAAVNDAMRPNDGLEGIMLAKHAVEQCEKKGENRG